MPDISTELSNIMNARYGKDVRKSIHDGIKKVNDNLEDVGVDELLDIRVGADGVIYTSAGEAVRSQFNNSLTSYGTLVDANNYETVLPDLNEAKDDKVYRLNFANDTSDCPLNLPEGLPNGQICVLFVINGNANTVGCTQILYNSVGLYYRWTYKNSSDDPILWIPWHTISNPNTIKYISTAVIDTNNTLGLSSLADAEQNSIYDFAITPTGFNNFKESFSDLPEELKKYLQHRQINCSLITLSNTDFTLCIQILFNVDNGCFYISNMDSDGSGGVVRSKWLSCVGNRYNGLLCDDATIYVDKTKSYTYHSLTEAIMDACNYKNVTVYVYRGTYDIIEEFKEYYGDDFFDNFISSSPKGIYLYNGVKVIFSSDAEVTCNYEGTNSNVMALFSPFNYGASGGVGFTLENLTLKAKNCRYCIHDEAGSNDLIYKNVYRNCNLYLDNSMNTAWRFHQCIGGGVGVNAEIIIENCIFESEYENSIDNINLAGIVSYHNSASQYAKNRIVIKDSYFKGYGTARISWYGQSQKISEAIISGNSFGSAIQYRQETSDGSSPYQNFELYDFNNEIRNEE